MTKSPETSAPGSASPQGPTATAREAGIEVIASGAPYLGGWGVGEPWPLSEGDIAAIRRRIYEFAWHRNAFMLADPHLIETVRSQLVPLSRLAVVVFERLNGGLVQIWDGAAVSALLGGLDSELAGSAETSGVVVSVSRWTTGPDTPWPVQILASDSLRVERAGATRMLLEVVRAFADLPPLHDVADATARVLQRLLRDTPTAEFEAADVPDLERRLAAAAEAEGAGEVPFFTGVGPYLRAQLDRAETAGEQVAETTELPDPADLLVAEFAHAGLPLHECYRSVLGTRFDAMRDEVAAARANRLTASQITDALTAGTHLGGPVVRTSTPGRTAADVADALAAAVRAGRAGEACEWAQAVYRLLTTGLCIASGRRRLPVTVDLGALAADLANRPRPAQQILPVGAEEPSRRQGALARLDEMVGLDTVKQAVRTPPRASP